MKRKIIPCQVRCEQVLGAGVVAGAAGSGGDAVLQLEFGPMWEGLVKYVTFRNALKEDPVTMILTTDKGRGSQAPLRPVTPARNAGRSRAFRLCLLGSKMRGWGQSGGLKQRKPHRCKV